MLKSGLVQKIEKITMMPSRSFQIQPEHQTIDRIAAAILLFVGSLTVLAGAIIAPSLPAIAQHLATQGLTIESANFWGKMLVSIPALVILVCSPLMGYVIDRHGRRNVLLSGLFLFALSGVWGGIHPQFYSLIISRMGLGLSVAMSMTTAMTLISDYFKGHERERFMGYFSSAMALGGIVYFILGGFVATVNWRAPFFIYLLALPAFVLAYFHIPEPVLEKSQNYSFGEKTNAFSAPQKTPTLVIAMLYATALLNMVIYFAIPTQLSFLLRNIGFNSPLHVGLTTACCSIAVTIISVNYGKIKERFSHPFIFSAGFLMTGLGYAIIYFGENYAAVAIGLFFAGLGFGCVMPNLSTWLMRVAPLAIRGRVIGGLGSSINMGQFSSPILAHFIIAFGAQTVCVFGIFSLVSLGVGLFYTAFTLIKKD